MFIVAVKVATIVVWFTFGLVLRRAKLCVELDAFFCTTVVWITFDLVLRCAKLCVELDAFFLGHVLFFGGRCCYANRWVMVASALRYAQNMCIG